MDSSLDLSRWRAVPRGIGYRRWVMVTTGVRQLLRTRYFKILLSLAWSAAILIGFAAFAFGQSIATGGWLETFAVKLGPRFEAIIAVVGALVVMYPEICVGGAFGGMFWLHSFLGLGLGFFALTALVPHLITRDRASNALTVYLARPLTTFDYLLGKLGTIVGVLVLLWTGPLLCGWLLAVLLAPGRDFFVYSLEPLGRALLFHAVAMVALAAVALGISALARRPRGAIALWLGLWIVFGVAAQPPRSPVWIKRASISHNLSQARQVIFALDKNLNAAATELPLIDQSIVADLTRASRRAAATDARGAFAALAAFILAAALVFLRRLRPE